MRRIAFCVALIFALMSSWAVAQEDNGAKKEVAPQKAEATDAQPEAAEKTTEKTVAGDEKLVADPKETEQDKPVQPTLGEDGLYQIEKNIVDFTNRERVRRGLLPLEIDKKLVESARGQAKWMTKTRRLEHTRKPVGENIAMGYRNSKEVVRGWMNSSGHRANILNSGYRRIGVAAYKAKDGSVWWCQQFLR